MKIYLKAATGAIVSRWMLALFYAFTFMCTAIFSNYMPIYLSQLGFQQTDIGILLSVATIISILGQPLWGYFTDRSRCKNNVLFLLLVGSGSSLMFVPLFHNLLYLCTTIAVFSFFQSSINPMSDVIAFEYAHKTSAKYGMIRLSGTVGYALMALIAGIVLNRHINNMFPLYFLLNFLALLMLLWVPRIEGHQKNDAHFHPWMVLRDKKLVLYIVTAFVFLTTSNFYATFYGIYFTKLGGSSTLLGCSFFIGAMSELPFLLFSHRILKKINIEYLLIFAGSAAALRWLLIGITRSIPILIGLQLMHGMIYIIIMVSISYYISLTVTPELQASGQAINALVCGGAAKIAGSLIGGYLSDLFSIRAGFFFCSGLALVAVAAFTVIRGFRNKAPLN